MGDCMKGESYRPLDGGFEPSEEAGLPAWKRGLDLVCIALGLPVVLPVALVVAGYILLVSPGPVLFRQQRVGYRGRRFMCLKFRTMVRNADTHAHQTYLAHLIHSDRPMNKLDERGDARLLPCSRWLRTLGLDELPQLINVLRGDMSLVGPRPCVVYEFEHYEPRHQQRCLTPPGLTGLWQVSGKNNTTFEEMIALDLHYAQQRSLWLDLKILALTIPALLTQAWELKTRSKTRLQAPIVRPGAISHQTGTEQ